MVNLQHKVRWMAYVLVGLLVLRAVAGLVRGEVGEGVGILIAAAVVFGCQRLLERDGRDSRSDGQDTIT